MKAVALYARVSSRSQERQATVESQIEALKERAESDGHVVLASDLYVDDGHSGASLVRPALEKLRDRAAEGGLDLLYIHSPDRLARKYAYQVLLLEEFSRQGVTVTFLNGPSGGNAEDELLVQVQGMIAEYERAKIQERSRRGKLHKARMGLVNPLSGAPFGYEYIKKSEGEPARYQVLLHEAKVVRDVYRWFVEEQVPIRGIAERLRRQQVPTRRGNLQWGTSSVQCILRNTAYAGRAAFGKTVTEAKHLLLLPPRGRSGLPLRDKSSARARPRSEWISIPVPPLVSEEMFMAAQEQLERNRQLSARNARGERYMLQGLLKCACCGSNFYGRTASKPLKRSGRRLSYYRCGGNDSWRFGGKPICRNRQVRVDMLDQFVWESVNDVIQDPERLVEEWTRRGADDGELGHAREHCDEAQRFLRVQKHTLQRLQDAFEAGALTIEELTERSGRVRARIARAEEDLADARASLTKSLEIHALAGKLSTFAEQVRSGLERLDWHARRQLIRTLVSRVEIDEEGATIVYRIPSSPRRPGEPAAVGGPGPKAEPKTSDVQLRSGGEDAVVAGEVEVGVRDKGGES